MASAPDQTVLRSDNLHPNENGQLALSLLVLQALQQAREAELLAELEGV